MTEADGSRRQSAKPADPAGGRVSGAIEGDAGVDTARVAASGIAWHDVRRVHPGARGRPPVVALDDLRLDAPGGRLLVLVGPSGSGKSTALRAVAGIEPLDGGRVHLGAVDVTDVPPHERDVAMVFQDLALFPHMSVADNILFGPLVRGLPQTERERRLAAVAESLDLAEVLARRPAQLSGGQRQRVALARAMVREPSAFLLDEPLSNLDARLRMDARAELVALQRRLGTTMVYVTHDQAEAMTMGDTIAVLRDGRLEQSGTPRDIYDTPATTFVATFFGTPPMNLLPGDTPLLRVDPQQQIGLRAEDLDLVEEGTRATKGLAGTDGLAGTVVAREDLGSEVVLQVHTAVGRLAVRRPAREATAPGTTVALVVADGGRVHRFAADGRRVEMT